MRHTHPYGRVAALLLPALLLMTPTPLPAFPQPALSITSGPVTGADYAVASAVAKIFNRRRVDYGMWLATVESDGSLANVDAVVSGKAAFGIAQADTLQRAAQGRGPWAGRPQDGLRAVLGLHVEAVTIVAAQDRKIEGVRDLRGKRVNIGAPGSADNEYAAALLESAGVLPSDVTLVQRPTATAPDLLQVDEIDAYICRVGHPNLALLEASTGKRKVRLVPLDAALIEQATARNPLLFPTTIPTRYYPALEGQGPVPTIGVRAVLFTRVDMVDETVYRLVRDVLTEFALFQRQHPVLQSLTTQESCGITVIPYHPAAERYCRDAGLAP